MHLSSYSLEGFLSSDIPIDIYLVCYKSYPPLL